MAVPVDVSVRYRSGENDREWGDPSGPDEGRAYAGTMVYAHARTPAGMRVRGVFDEAILVDFRMNDFWLAWDTEPGVVYIWDGTYRREGEHCRFQGEIEVVRIEAVGRPGA